MQLDSRKRAPAMERTNTPGIYKRGSRYVVVWKHRGRQHKSFHRTLAEAREAKGRRASGDSKPPTREAFEDYALRWLDTYQGRTARGIGRRTLASYRRDLERYAFPHFRGYRLADVDPSDVRGLLRELRERGLRPATLRRVLAPLRAMFATAVEDGDLPRNTATVRVTGDKGGPEGREVRALTRAELARFLAELPEERRLFFELLAHTGLRISEAVGLEWHDLEFGERPRVKVRRQDHRGEVGELKSDYSRRDVPLSPGVARRLWVLGADRPGTERVFTSARGRPLHDGNLRRRVLKPAAERAGVPWAAFHTFRHTCASLLFAEGRNVLQVARWLGHADPAFTLRTYVHLMDEGVEDAAFFDDVIEPDPARTLGGWQRVEAAP